GSNTRMQLHYDKRLRKQEAHPIRCGLLSALRFPNSGRANSNQLERGQRSTSWQSFVLREIHAITSAPPSDADIPVPTVETLSRRRRRSLTRGQQVGGLRQESRPAKGISLAGLFPGAIGAL